MKTIDTSQALVEFTCECGKRAGVTSMNLYHHLPYCDEFRDLAPDEYLRRNRERMQKGEN